MLTPNSAPLPVRSREYDLEVEVSATVRVTLTATSEEEATDALTRATELLDKSERLLDALDSLHERDNLNNRVQALLVDDADLHEDEILDLWLAADGLAAEADELLAGLGTSIQEEIVETTDRTLGAARGLLRPLPKTDEVTMQRTRASSLRARCDAHRKLISHS